MIRRVLKKYFGKIERQAKFTKKRLEEKEVIPKDLMIKQYPKNLSDPNPTIFDPNLKYEYITPRHQIENSFFCDKAAITSPEENINSTQKLARVALIGAPNSGKSSLINKLVDQKLNAVSKISNTTSENRENIKTFIDSHTQVIYFDTPGLTSNKNRKESINHAWSAVQESDFVFLVVDCLKRIDSNLVEILRKLQSFRLSKERKIAENLLNKIPSRIENMENQQLRICLVLNKVDLCNNKRRLLSIRDELEDYLHFENIFITSAETGFGLNFLENYLLENAEAGKWEYDKKVVSNMTEIEIIEEMARNSIYNTFWKELPYKMPVKLEELSFRSDKRAQLRFKFYVHKRVQKLMLIGKGGKNMRDLRRLISRDFVERYGIKCDVHIRVGLKNLIEQGGDQIYFRGDEQAVNEGEIAELRAHRLNLIKERRDKESDMKQEMENAFEKMMEEYKELIY